MKFLIRTLAIILAAINTFFALLMLATAYADRIDPSVHPILSCIGLTFPIVLVINICCYLLILIMQQYKLLWFPTLAFILCFGQIRDTLPIHLFAEDAPLNSSKLLSYNVMAFNGLESDKGGERVLEYLKSSDAHIICLQEYAVGLSKNHITQRQVDKALSDYKYHRINKIGKGKKGHASTLACYSKYPILSAKPLKLESLYNGAVAYELKIDNDTVLLINCHLESNRLTSADRQLYEEILEMPEGEKLKSNSKTLLRKLALAANIRGAQAKAIAQVIQESKHKKVMVCGDFNDTSTSFSHRTISQGLQDAFTETGTGLGTSYHQHFFYFKIDHILCSPGIQPYQCEVDNDIKESDHYPIMCHFRILQ